MGGTSTTTSTTTTTGEPTTTSTTTPLTTTTITSTTVTTHCTVCHDGKKIRNLGDCWFDVVDPCVEMTCKLEFGKCNVGVKRIIDPPSPPTCAKGEYLDTTKLKDVCGDEHQCLPCKCCTEKEANCPKIEDPK